MLAGTGSARIAAGSRRAVAPARASGSFQGTITVAAAAAAGTPGAGRDALGGQAGTRLGEQPVDVAVVGAGELEDRVAAGGGAGQPDGAHRRLGPGRGHAQHLHGGEPLETSSASSTSPARGRAERRAASRRLRDGRDHVGMRVAEDQRAPGADPVDVAIAVDVVMIGAGARAMKMGSRPIERIARTGEFTPPGIRRRARLVELRRARGVEPRCRSHARVLTFPIPVVLR